MWPCTPGTPEPIELGWWVSVAWLAFLPRSVVELWSSVIVYMTWSGCGMWVWLCSSYLQIVAGHLCSLDVTKLIECSGLIPVPQSQAACVYSANSSNRHCELRNLISLNLFCKIELIIDSYSQDGVKCVTTCPTGTAHFSWQNCCHFCH